MRLGQLGPAGGQLVLRETEVPDQAQLPQERQAHFEVAEGMPRLVQRHVAVGDLEQAQRTRTRRTVGLESLRGLTVGLDGLLVTAQASLAVAEQVKKVGPVVPGSSPQPQGPQALLRCHGSPSACCDVSFIRRCTSLNSPPWRTRRVHEISRTIADECRA